MKPLLILWIYAILAVLDLAWGLYLSLLNYRNLGRAGDGLPEELHDAFSPDELTKAAAYSAARMRLSFVESPLGAILTLTIALSGLFGLYYGVVANIVVDGFFRGALFLGSILALSSLFGLPFSLYSTFVLEKRFGFNTTSLRTWCLDLLKSAVLGLILGFGLYYLFYRFMNAAGALWWLWAALAFSLVNLVLSFLYPLLIAPLFNKFSPLAAGSLSDRIGELGARLGFRFKGVYVMDGSKRSRHSNAYFTGFGASRRIVLYDTLLASMGEEEVLAVLAHEIGHWRKGHLAKGMALSIALSFAGFWILSLLAGYPPLYAAFGLPGPSTEALLLVFGLLSDPATFFLTPLLSAWSRRHEYEADRCAVENAGADALASALVKLNKENASNLHPHPLYSFWYYSHPTLVERLAAIRAKA